MAELDEILSAIGEVGKKVDGLETRVTALEEVATANLAKLAERKKLGTIIGNGDGITKEERL